MLHTGGYRPKMTPWILGFHFCMWESWLVFLPLWVIYLHSFAVCSKQTHTRWLSAVLGQALGWSPEISQISQIHKEKENHRATIS